MVVRTRRSVYVVVVVDVLTMTDPVFKMRGKIIFFLKIDLPIRPL